MSLDRIMHRLGHEGRRLTVLKVDCEGCEWDAFHHIAMHAPTLIERIDAVYIELHLALQMSSEEDLIKWATMYSLFFERGGLKLWWLHENRARAPGGPGVHPEIARIARSVSQQSGRRAGLLAGAWELGLHRPLPGRHGTDDSSSKEPHLSCPKVSRPRSS